MNAQSIKSIAAAALTITINTALAGPADFDGDGFDDVLVRDPVYQGAQSTGAVGFYSGQQSTLIHEFVSPVSESLFGYEALMLPDSTGDGVMDILIFAPLEVLEPGRLGVAFLYSGSDFQLVASLNAPPESLLLWDAVSMQDVDGDGLIDISIRTLQLDSQDVYSEQWAVYSSANGRLLDTGLSPDLHAQYAGLPSPLNSVPMPTSDVDKDGIVSYLDALYIANAIGTVVPTASPKDVVVDGYVDWNDLSAVVSSSGATVDAIDFLSTDSQSVFSTEIWTILSSSLVEKAVSKGLADWEEMFGGITPSYRQFDGTIHPWAPNAQLTGGPNPCQINEPVLVYDSYQLSFGSAAITSATTFYEWEVISGESHLDSWLTNGANDSGNVFVFIPTAGVEGSLLVRASYTNDCGLVRWVTAGIDLAPCGSLDMTVSDDAPVFGDTVTITASVVPSGSVQGWEIVSGQSLVSTSTTNGDSITLNFGGFSGLVSIKATYEITGTGGCVYEAYQLITVSPGEGDYDNDGIKDVCEDLFGTDGADSNNYPTDQTDSDSDGLTDVAECGVGTDPDNPDSDGDGIRDGTELAWGLDPSNSDENMDGISDGDADRDHDGLPDAIEDLLGTDPLDFDSDNDGIPDGMEDADGDLLPSRIELSIGTNPILFDTDSDGTFDGHEDADGDTLTNLNEYQQGTDPALVDSDFDLLDDPDEYTHNSNPRDRDSDNDGLWDGLEVHSGLDPIDAYSYALGVLDGYSDQDGDQLTALQEVMLGTSLTNADTDSNGVDDPDEDFDFDTLSNLYELTISSNPLSSDSDSDYLADPDEILYGTLISKPDTDGDGILDGIEVQLGFDPLDDDSDDDGVDDGDQDSDGDGVSDATENEMGTDPNNPDSDGDGTSDGNEDTDGDGVPNWQEDLNGGDPQNPSDYGMPEYAFDESESVLEYWNGLNGHVIDDPSQSWDIYLIFSFDTTTVYPHFDNDNGWSTDWYDTIAKGPGVYLSSSTFIRDTYFDSPANERFWSLAPLHGIGTGQDRESFAVGARTHSSSIRNALTIAPADKLFFDPDYQTGMAYMHANKGYTVVGELDLLTDMDSDGVIQPDETAIHNFPQQYIENTSIGRQDADGDSIPDYADGYNILDAISEDDQLEADTFVAMGLALNLGDADQLQDLVNFGLVFSYSGFNGHPTYELFDDNSIEFRRVSLRRLWNKPSYERRSVDSIQLGGDFIEPDTFVSLQDFGYDGPRVYPLFMELMSSESTSPNSAGYVDSKLHVYLASRDSNGNISEDYNYTANDPLANIASDEINFRTFEIEVLQVLADGSLTIHSAEYETGEHESRYIPDSDSLGSFSPMVSAPTPHFNSIVFSVDDLQTSNDNSGPELSISISGTILDRSMGFIEDPLIGITDDLVLQYRNRNGELIEVDIPVTTIKETDFNHYGNPYPYEGSFTTSMTLPVSPGNNQFELLVTNRYGFTGHYAQTVNVIPEPPQDDFYQIAITVANAFGAGPGSVVHAGFISVQDQDGNNITADPVTGETSLKIYETLDGIFEARDSHDIVHLTLRDFEVNEDGSVVLFDMDISNPIYEDTFVTLGLNHAGFYENIVTLLGIEDRVDYTDYTWDYDLLNPIWTHFEDGEDGVKPFFIQVSEWLASNSDTITVGDMTLYVHLTDNYGYVLTANPSSDYPTPMLAIPDFTSNPQPLGNPGEPDGFGTFLQGFATGAAIDTPASVFEGVFKIIQIRMNIGRFQSRLEQDYFDMEQNLIRFIRTGSPLVESDRVVFDTSVYVITVLAPDVFKIVQGQIDTINAAYGGDLEAMSKVAKQYGQALEYTLEIIDTLRDELDNMTTFEQGRLFGRIVGEAALAIGTSSTGVALLSKSATIEKVLGRLRLLDWIDDIHIEKLDDKFLGDGKFVQAIRTSSLCFTAGTLIHTDQGLVPIEQIQVGDMVLSKDPARGAEGFKPVVNLFQTNPETVLELTINGPQGLETIQSTPQHPFYEQTSGLFVLASELDKESILLTPENGPVAYITDIETQRGPPESNGLWTTYNLEVADWHTYFVGINAVWVHNEGPFCEQLAALLHQGLSKSNWDPDDLYELIFDLKQYEMSPADHGKLVEEIYRREIGRELGFFDESEPLISSWSPGPPGNGFKNLVAHHNYRLDDGSMPYDTPLKMLRRAVQLDEDAITILDPDRFFVVWRRLEGSWQKEIVVIDPNSPAIQGEILIISYADPANPVYKTLHKADDLEESVVSRTPRNGNEYQFEDPFEN